MAPRREQSLEEGVIDLALMPGKPFQSKLEPFYTFIRECRTKRWSYARIAAAITHDHGMSVSANAVFSFVKVRAKGRKLYALPESVGSAAFPAYQEAVAPGGRDLGQLAAEFFNPSNEPTKTETKHARRPYRIDG